MGYDGKAVLSKLELRLDSDIELLCWGLMVRASQLYQNYLQIVCH